MSASEPKTTYRLYALPLTLENVETAAQFRHSRATPTPAPGYVLIYTGEGKPDGAKEITEEQKEMLTADDARWLCDSRSTILFEEVEARLQEMKKGLPDIVEAIENELKRRKEELTNGGE